MEVFETTIHNLAEEKVNALSMAAHEIVGTRSGDITPEMALTFDALIEALADVTLSQALYNSHFQERGIELFKNAIIKLRERIS